MPRWRRKPLKEWPWWELHWTPAVRRRCEGSGKYHGTHTWVVIHQELPYKEFKRGVVIFLCDGYPR